MGIYINPVIYNSRPDPQTRRLEKENRTYDLLEKLGVAFCRIDHDATGSIEDCHEVDKLLQIKICKNLFLCNAQKTRFYLLMLPGDKVFKTKVISAQIGSSRLSFAPSEYMEKYLDITPGSVSVLGLMNDTQGMIQLLIDQDVLKEDYFGCHPCINTSSLRIKTADLLDTILPYIKHEPVLVEL